MSKYLRLALLCRRAQRRGARPLPILAHGRPRLGSGVELSGQKVSLNTFESDDFYLLDATILGDAQYRRQRQPALDAAARRILSALTSSKTNLTILAVSARQYGQKYDYFYTVHGRNGNGVGGNMISVVT